MRSIQVTICLLAILTVSTQAIKKGYDVGDVAADFKLKNVDGKATALADYTAAKGFIIIFDCNSCPVSRLYNKRIVELHKKYEAKGFPVVAINSNDEEKSPEDSFEEMVREAKNKKYEFAYLYDKTQEIAQTYGATNTPQVYVLAKEAGKLKVAYIGAIDNNARDGAKADKKYVENAVNALLESKQITVKKTKAIGCGIKWKDA